MSAADVLERDLLTSRYRVAPAAFWSAALLLGDGGYDVMEPARRQVWEAIPSWGRDGWDLGSWPLVIVFHRDTSACFELAEYVEGDVTVYRYPSRELRDAATDRLAFFHWEHEGEEWVGGIESADDMPSRLRGPFTRARLDASEGPS
jgi:hypothetical protein